MRSAAQWAKYWAKRIHTDTAASDPQRERARNAQTEAELAGLRTEVAYRVGEMRDCVDRREQARTRGDSEGAAAWDRMARNYARQAQQAAKQLGGHEAAEKDDKKAAAEAEAAATATLNQPAEEVPADSGSAESSPVTEDSADAAADGGNTTQTNQANLGFSDGTMAVPGMVAQPEPEGEGEDEGEDEGVKVATRQPGGTAFDPQWTIDPGDNGQLLPPGGQVIGNGTGTPGTVELPSVGGPVGVQTGGSNLLTMPPAQTTITNIFTWPDPSTDLQPESIAMPDWSLDPGLNIFSRATEQPSSTAGGAGEGVGGGVLGGGLGGGPDTQILVGPPDLPTTGGTGFPMPGLDLPGYDDVMAG
jgi:hypothetical protein